MFPVFARVHLRSGGKHEAHAVVLTLQNLKPGARNAPSGKILLGLLQFPTKRKSDPAKDFQFCTRTVYQTCLRVMLRDLNRVRLGIPLVLRGSPVLQHVGFRLGALVADLPELHDLLGVHAYYSVRCGEQVRREPRKQSAASKARGTAPAGDAEDEDAEDEDADDRDVDDRDADDRDSDDGHGNGLDDVGDGLAAADDAVPIGAAAGPSTAPGAPARPRLRFPGDLPTETVCKAQGVAGRALPLRRVCCAVLRSVQLGMILKQLAGRC